MLRPEECAWLKTETTQVTNIAEIVFKVPIKGLISVCFHHNQSFQDYRGLDGFKDLWQLPVRLLLKTAKVCILPDHVRDYLRVPDLQCAVWSKSLLTLLE